MTAKLIKRLTWWNSLLQLKEQQGLLQSKDAKQIRKFILMASILIPLLVIIWCLNYSFIVNTTHGAMTNLYIADYKGIPNSRKFQNLLQVHWGLSEVVIHVFVLTWFDMIWIWKHIRKSYYWFFLQIIYHINTGYFLQMTNSICNQ